MITQLMMTYETVKTILVMVMLNLKVEDKNKDEMTTMPQSVTMEMMSRDIVMGLMVVDPDAFSITNTSKNFHLPDDN